MRLTKEDIASDARINMLKYIRASVALLYSKIILLCGPLELVAIPS